MAQTSPALDLTVLFNGFKPLFQALSPSDLNKLSYEIVQVFQGEGGTLEGLLAHTASVTSTLAARDEVIGSLIDNLDQVLDHIGDRDDQLVRLIKTFRTFVGGLKDDREAILGSLDQISALSVETADLVSGIRQPFVEDIKQLRTFAGNLDRNKGEIDRVMQVLPIKLTKIGRTAIYGSWFNFYLCDFKGRVQLPGGTDPAARLQRPAPTGATCEPHHERARCAHALRGGPMSVPFRARNPVIIGAVSLAVIAALILAAFRAQDLPLIGGGDTYYAAFTEAGGLKAERRGPHRGRPGRQGREGRAGRRPRPGDLPGRRRRRVRRRDAGGDQGEDDARRHVPRAPARRRRAARGGRRDPAWSARARRTTSSTPSPAWPRPPRRSTPTSWPSR